MENDKAEIARFLKKQKDVGLVEVSDPAQLGGSQTSLELPFACFLHANGCNEFSGDKWNEGDFGFIAFDRSHEVTFAAMVYTDEVVIADIAVEGIDGNSHMQFDEVGFTAGQNQADKDANPNTGKTVFRLITSTAEGPDAIRKVVLRLVDKDGQPAPVPQPEWRIQSITIWKATFS
jgi:hypothetical protein